MKKSILILFAIFAIKNIYAQTPEEVKAIFPDNDVVILKYEKKLNIKFKNGEPVAESEYLIRRMFLNKNTANFYSKYKVAHSSFGTLSDLQAYAVNAGGNKVKATNIQTANSSSNSIFYDDVKETSFDFTGLSENSITNVEYTLFHKDAHLLNPFFFSSYLSVLNTSYSVTFPNDADVKYIIKNDPGNTISFTQEKRKKETVYTWTAKNIKQTDDYADAPSDDYFVPHVIVYLASYKEKNAVHKYLGDINDLYKWNYSFTDKVNNVVDPNLQSLVTAIIKGTDNEMEKARRIYKWVQHNIKYVAFENDIEGFRPRDAGAVYTKRYGDCKDMCSLITEMLKMANLKAYYTWIGTRDISYAYSEVPLPASSNHMISTLNINNEWLFLDGTDPNATFGTAPPHIQGKEAMIAVNDTTYKILKVPVIDARDNIISDSIRINITDKGIAASEKVSFHGYPANRIYSVLDHDDSLRTSEFVKQKLKKGSNKYLLMNYKINRYDSVKNLLDITADFEVPDYCKKVGNEIYINLNLDKQLDNLSVDTAKRKVPKEIDYKFISKQYNILEVPKGYKVSHNPDDFTYDNDMLSIKITYSKTANIIVAFQALEIKKLLITPEDFNGWNKAIKTAEQQYKQVVVLTKF